MKTPKKTMYVIETERTYLRLPTIDDLDALAVVFGNPQVMKYLDFDCQPLTREQTEKMLISIIEGWKKNGFGRWTVFSKEDDQLIGLAGLRKHEDIAELVYILNEPFWGKGLATELANEVLRAGFANHDFPKIIAMTRPGNAASRRILAKLKMHFNGEAETYGIQIVEYEMTRKDYELR